MKTSRIQKMVAAIALAVTALIAVPATAHAISYPPNDSFIAPPPATAAPGGTVTLAFGPGSFDPGQPVFFTLTGENASGATLAIFRAAVNSVGTTKNAAADGSLSSSVALPSNAVGTYTLTASSGSWSRTWVINVGGATAAGVGNVLAESGAPNQLLWIWSAGGALALLGGGAVVFASVRKQRKLAA